MSRIFDFDKSGYEANSHTELLLGPREKNAPFGISFTVGLQAARLGQLFAWVGACLFGHISLFKSKNFF